MAGGRKDDPSSLATGVIVTPREAQQGRVPRVSGGLPQSTVGIAERNL